MKALRPRTRARGAVSNRPAWRSAAAALAAAASLLASSLTPALAPSRATAAPSVCAQHYPSDRRVVSECRRLARGQTLERAFGAQWQDVARFNRIDRRHAAPGTSIRVPVDLGSIVNFAPLPSRFAPAEPYPKFILIDLSEQFLGAYEHGRLVFSAPVTSGTAIHPTPTGHFRVNAAHRSHESNMYTVEDMGIPYPMHYALRFFTNRSGEMFWIHGRDLPGYPASHGCVGLADEEMQLDYYGDPVNPILDDARRLYEWALGPTADDGSLHLIAAGPPVWVVGSSAEENPVSTWEAPASGTSGGD